MDDALADATCGVLQALPVTSHGGEGNGMLAWTQASALCACTDAQRVRSPAKSLDATAPPFAPHSAMTIGIIQTLISHGH